MGTQLDAAQTRRRSGAHRVGKAIGMALTRPDLLDRPRLAPDVLVHEPVEDGAPWMLQRGTRQYYRVAADLARLIRAVDGARDHAGLVAILGKPWTTADIDKAVRQLATAKLLDDGQPRRKSNSVIKFVAPLSVQVALLKPERFLARVAPILRPLIGRTGAVVAGLLGFCGFVALVVQAPVVSSALGRPLPPTTYFAVFAAILLTTALHELGHGAVLTSFGGKPSRMGFMLFYLAPAFFCDVSDGWRLPRRGSRVAVALAGIVTQVVIAGIAAIVTPLVGDPNIRDGLLVFAVATYVAGALNLVPFVKLDGYIALMSHLDISHLRDRAMTDARALLARVLFGGTYRRELPQLRWAAGYGMACMAFPVYIVLGALTLWVDVFQRLGVVGAALVLSGLGILGCWLVRGFVRIVTVARDRGASIARIATVTTVIAGVVAAAMIFVKVPYTLSGGYISRADGGIEIVLPPSTDQDAIRPGLAVTLYRSGLMTSRQTGSAILAASAVNETTAPISVLVPVQTDVFPIPVLGLDATVTVQPDDSTGIALVRAGDMPVWNWLFSKYVAPALRW